MTREGPSEMPRGKRIHVAAGVLRDAADRVLVQQRAVDSHQGGLWEFPGGKLEPGEEPFDALCRELHEELGIRVVESSRLVTVEHAYSDRLVILDVWRVIRFEGRVLAREHQPLRWIDVRHLPNLPMPDADRPIIDAILQP